MDLQIAKALCIERKKLVLIKLCAFSLNISRRSIKKYKGRMKRVVGCWEEGVEVKKKMIES